MRNLDFVPLCLWGKSPLGDQCAASARKQTQLLHCSVPSPGGFCAEVLLPSALVSPLPAQPGPLFSFLLPLPCFSTTFHILAHPTLSLDKTLVSCYLFFSFCFFIEPLSFPCPFCFTSRFISTQCSMFSFMHFLQ